MEKAEEMKRLWGDISRDSLGAATSDKLFDPNAREFREFVKDLAIRSKAHRYSVERPFHYNFKRLKNRLEGSVLLNRKS